MRIFLLFLSFSVFGNEITGFWRSYDDKTNKPQMVVAIYEHKGFCYGRIVGLYNKKEVVAETLEKPFSKAPGIIDDPYYCGLDLIYNLKQSGRKFYGKIVDPEKGNIYDAEVWRKGQDLIVRGKLLFFGRSLTWCPFPEEDFNRDFPQPQTSEFIPKIPLIKE